MDEQKLIQQVSEGDQDAFREIVRANRDMVINVCYNLLNDREQAEEVAQDVFLSIFKRAGKLKGKSRLSTWIYRWAVNSAISARRRKRLLKTRVDIRQEAAADVASLKAPLADSPDFRLEAAEIRAAIHKALDSLPEKQRAFIILHKMEGLSAREIAQIFRISVSSSEARIHRAKRNLRKELTRLLSLSLGKNTFITEP